MSTPGYDVEKQRAANRKSYLSHRDERRKKAMEYYLENRTKRMKQMRERFLKKYHSDPEYKKKYLEESRKNYRKYIAMYSLRNAIQSHSKKQYARIRVREAIKYGRMVRPGSCDSCNKACKPHGHHHKGYDNPLKVIWLCTGCHAIVHRKP